MKRIPPLSELQVRRAKPKEKAYKLFDGGGLYLYVSPAGGKSWRMKYKAQDGKYKTLTFGLYPAVGLKEAREKREAVRRKLEAGEDPRAEKREKQAVPSFEAIARRYLEDAHAKGKIGESQLTRQTRRLELYVFPRFGATPITEVSRPQIIEIIEELATDKAETASRVLTLIGAVYRFAAAREIVPHNIVADIDRKSLIPSRRDRHFPTLTDPRDIAGLLLAVEGYPDEIVKRALLFQILTAVRPGNIRLAKWEQIDGGRWIIPGDEMKGGRPHVVPLSGWALRVLEEVRRYGESRYIFPSPVYRDRPISENTLGYALKRLGYKDKIVPHGFRAMFSTVAHERIAEHGVHSLAIEAQLAHKERNEVKAAYNHAEYLDERKRLMEWWAEWLEGLIR